MIQASDLTIETLGPARVISPLQACLISGMCKAAFVSEDDYMVFNPRLKDIKNALAEKCEIPAMESAGARANIFFNPEKTGAAIVTCGGLCPGLNDVIRGLVMQLFYRYGVKRIFGVRYGFQGFIEKYGHEVLELTPRLVGHIHRNGGSILSTSRGRQSNSAIIDFLVKRDIQLLFVIGGDGTMRAACEIGNEVKRLKKMISIIGIPKTIDNDILYIDQSFGFETAFSKAVESIEAAHNEALGVPNGIGLVKLMGRASGFIACHAALAMNDVNYVLIPEVPFELDGPHGFLSVLKRRFQSHNHAVIVVAEGAGQELMGVKDLGTDASGNPQLKDVGLFLKHKIEAFFKNEKMQVNVKYIDPSYTIRSVPALPDDSVYCLRLAENAVHAAMSGRTKMVVARRHDHYVHLPMQLLSSGRKQVDPDGELWLSVLEATGQPPEFGNLEPKKKQKNVTTLH